MSTFAQDTFTDTAGTALTSHTATVGGAWAAVINAGVISVSSTGTAYISTATASMSVFAIPATLPGGTVTVSWDAVCKSLVEADMLGVVLTDNAGNVYRCGYYHTAGAGAGWYLQRFSSLGVQATLGGPSTTNAPTAGVTRAVVLTYDPSAHAFTVSVNGTDLFGTLTDSTYTPTKVGLGIGTATAQSNTTGIHVDNLSAAAGTPATAFTLTGPSAGPANAASTNFTVTPTGGTTSGTFTPSVISGVSYSPTTLTWSGDAAAKTFTATKTAAGTVSINGTFSTGETPPSSVSYTAKTTTTEDLYVNNAMPSTTTYLAIKNVDLTYFSAETTTGVSEPAAGQYKATARVVPSDYSGTAVWRQGSAYAIDGIAPATGLKRISFGGGF